MMVPRKFGYQGSPVRLVAAALLIAALVAIPTLSAAGATRADPTTNMILFTLDTDGPNRADIMVVSADGSNPTTLIGGLANDQAPVWSPDHSKVAFVRGMKGQSRLFVADGDGSRPRALTSGDLAVGRPSWSPDGGSLTFAGAYPEDNPDIYTIRADGTHLRRLTKWEQSETEPSWSPDGSRILFVRELDPVCSAGSPCGEELFTISPHGRKPTRITNFQGSEYDPTWSPDAQLIAFAAIECVGVVGCTLGDDVEIYTIAPDGTARRQITDNDEDDRFPAFSPDGAWIAFAQSDTSRGWPYLGDIIRAPADGNYIVPFVVEGSDDRPVAATQHAETFPDW